MDITHLRPPPENVDLQHEVFYVYGVIDHEREDGDGDGGCHRADMYSADARTR